VRVTVFAPTVPAMPNMLNEVISFWGGAEESPPPPPQADNIRVHTKIIANNISVFLIIPSIFKVVLQKFSIFFVISFE
jgi:hypothetical protein